MNTINFAQTGGFPVETEVFAELQKNIQMLNDFSGLVGNFSIVKGCKVVGSTVSDGTVYVDGELLEFKGGSLQSHVVVKEDTIDLEFEDGLVKPVYHRRYATFSIAISGSIPWSNFKRVYPLTSALVLDEIKMFAGDILNLSAGWYLCDGTNGTVNLQGKFIVGLNPADADYNSIGKFGGAKKVTPSATASQKSVEVTIPRDYWGKTGGPLGSVSSGRLVVGSGQNENAESLESLRSAGHNKTVSSSSHNHNISVSEHENRPPYYTLAYIQFKGI